MLAAELDHKSVLDSRDPILSLYAFLCQVVNGALNMLEIEKRIDMKEISYWHHVNKQYKPPKFSGLNTIF